MENNKLFIFIKNISYTFLSNFLSMIISAMLLLIVPKFIGVESYAYYQLYVFYMQYVHVLYLGWCDGIYLRLGGAYYNELNQSLYSTQFYLLGMMEVLIFGALLFISPLFIDNVDKLFVMGCTCAAGIGVCLRWFILYILQPTARIKEYAITMISEKIVLAAGVFLIIFAGFADFHVLIIVDVVAKYISLLIGIYFCRDLLFHGFKPRKEVFIEIAENISSGFKLMLSALCSMLIIGVLRYGIESYWDVSTFGKVSLTLSLTNIIMAGINAMAAVMYPMLRRTNKDNLSRIYPAVRLLLMVLVFGCLTFYYPAQSILVKWLPQYAESLRYAAILFPMCAYESKISMLINTYYKTLRLEKLLMRCNLAALVLSVACNFVSTIVLGSLTAAILSILFTLVFRCVICELLLARNIEIKVKKDIAIELVMTATFIICNWYLGLIGMFIYAIFYVMYLLFYRNEIFDTVAFIKSMR